MIIVKMLQEPIKVIITFGNTLYIKQDMMFFKYTINYYLN